MSIEKRMAFATPLCILTTPAKLKRWASMLTHGLVNHIGACPPNLLRYSTISGTFYKQQVYCVLRLIPACIKYLVYHTPTCCLTSVF